MGLFDDFSWHHFFDPGKFTYGDKPTPDQFQDRGQMQQMLGQGVNQYTNMQSPQLQMGGDPFRQAQLGQLAQLQGVASGQHQGAGELAAQRQYANAMAAQQAQARMARGGNAALAYRNAANQSAALGSTAAGMGQQAAMQDQMAAHGLMGQVGASGRQNDVNVANANAGFQQNTNQMNSANYLQFLNQLNNQNIAKYNADLGIGSQRESADASKTGGLIAGLGAAFASDERLKENVSDARGEIDQLLDALKPVAWDYKDTKHGDGRWNGIIAQDMERSEAGKRIVIDTPEGKMIDLKKAVCASLAAAARLNERVRKMEKT